MEHSAGCMEYKDGDQSSFGSALAHRPRPLPTVRSIIPPKEETKTQRLLNNRGQTSEIRGQQTHKPGKGKALKAKLSRFDNSQNVKMT